MAYKTKPSLDSLSDLDKKTAIATLAAMKYSDIIQLSYRAALRLWLPLNRGKYRADQLRCVATIPPNISSLRLRVEDLEDRWAEHHRIAGGRRPDSHKYPSIFYNQVWNDARGEEHRNSDGSVDIENRCKSLDFIYSDDGDLRWVGT
jgi:hypothetical protein